MEHATPSEREAGYKQLWQAHQGIVVRMARYYSANKTDQDDLTQEIACQLWRSFQNFRGESLLSTWVYRVALNTCLAFHRKSKPRYVEMQEVPDARITVSMEEQMDQQSLLTAIQAFAAQFKPVDQSLLLLLMEGISYDEMATITGLTESHVGVRINRLRKRIKARFP